MKKKDSFVTIEELSRSEGIWQTGVMDDSDIVLKGSITISRNVDDFIFTHKLSKKEKQRIARYLLDCIKQNQYCFDFSVYNLGTISHVDKKILFERNILKVNAVNDGLLVVSHDENYHFHLCGNEHLEVTVQKSGFHFDDIYVNSKKTIGDIEKRVNFAFSREFGYLTAFPDRSGSGVVMIATLHLPGLILSSGINEVVFGLEKQGLGIKSSWIDGYYEVYNKYSKGRSEKEIYVNTLSLFQKLIRCERENRESEYQLHKAFIEDKVWRSYGILLSSRLISLHEALDFLSYLRLGISLGIISYLTIKDINLLLYYTQDFHLKKRYNIRDESENAEEARAQFLRDYLKEVI
jgi:protein arginine kinase